MFLTDSFPINQIQFNPGSFGGLLSIDLCGAKLFGEQSGFISLSTAKTFSQKPQKINTKWQYLRLSCGINWEPLEERSVNIKKLLIANNEPSSWDGCVVLLRRWSKEDSAICSSELVETWLQWKVMKVELLTKKQLFTLTTMMEAPMIISGDIYRFPFINGNRLKSSNRGLQSIMCHDYQS